MRALGILLVLGFLAGTPCAHPASPAGSLKISGKEYVRLSDWAGANGLKHRWINRETVQLSNSSTKFSFVVDSREARANGVGLWLGFPAVLHDGALYLSRLDAQTTLRPLLSPPKNPSRAPLKSVCLDPGHGGSDPGNCVGTYQEKKYTLLLAHEVRQQLTRAGLQVSLTRSNDAFIDLPLRAEIARRNKADLFLSLHFNSVATSRTVVRGAEVYCLTPVGASSTNTRGEGENAPGSSGNRFNNQNIFLAYTLQKALIRNPTVNDRGVHRARFAVLRDADMPAVLIEAAFMSHPEEGKRILDPAYRRQLARTISDGVLAYKRAVEQNG